MTVATFGERQEGIQYVNRYGVYAVIPDEKKENIILVQAPNGAWFLPGGEIEQDEDHLTALKRELIEELGLLLTLVNITEKQMNISILVTATLIFITLPTFMK